MVNESDSISGRRPVKPVEFKAQNDKTKQLGIPIVKLNKG
jgi:hypothetical protein